MSITLKSKIYGGFFDPESKEKRKKVLETETKQEDFWSSRENSNKIINELNQINKFLDDLYYIENKTASNIALLKDLKNNLDLEIKTLLELELDEIISKTEDLEIKVLLNKEYDDYNAIIEIHSGAGGTEACDWALMLYRMYLRYFDNKGYKYEILEEQTYDEAGIKSATVAVKGEYAYGYLKNEKGVHRLVRLSPFDSSSRRHTSFASVDVTPLFEENEVNIVINEEDLKIDVYRSSGAGGQHVNTTDSAVRITHLPTKVVVTCQVERSQIRNKERALEILKNKLYKLEIEKQNEDLKEIKGSNSDINFGSQIRSYVMHPYSLVKDHRTNVENVNVSKVLDGDLDLFINSNLKRGN